MLGAQYEVREYRTFEQLVDAVANERLDVVIALAATEQREVILDFSLPYYWPGLAIVVSQDSVGRGWSGLAGGIEIAPIFAAILLLMLLWLIARAVVLGFFIVVHKGEVVYEKYPGMRPDDNHLWMSVAKTLPSLVVDLLISDGKIDQNKTIGFYVPEFRGTGWENIKVIDVPDMTPGFRGDTLGITMARAIAKYLSSH